MDKHIIISVGRQVGSGGLTIARILSENLNCKLYDKELLNLAAKESGICKQLFERNDEKKGFFRGITHLHVPLLSDNNWYANNLSDESLYQFQSEAIRKAAETEDCVFVGRTADYILRGLPNKVDIFITANLDERIQRVAERHHINEDAAARLIKEKESARASYYNYYTGKRWGDSASYDLCINSSCFGIEGTAQFLLDYIKQRLHL